jgi:hypothetical protein
VGEADLHSSSLRAETDDVGDAGCLGEVGALLGCGIEDGETETDRRDTTPSGEEVTTGLLLGRVLNLRNCHDDTGIVVGNFGSGCVEVLRKELKLRCARRVIRHDSLDAGVLGDEFFPEAIAVLALSDRWAALVSSVTLLDLLSGQAEVVEASLGCDVDSRLASGLEKRNALGSGEVDDVEVKVRSNVRLAENLLDGVCFESRRSRLKEGLVGAELTSRGKGRF